MSDYEDEAIEIGPLYGVNLDDPRYECRDGDEGDLFGCAGCQAKMDDGLLRHEV